MIAYDVYEFDKKLFLTTIEARTLCEFKKGIVYSYSMFVNVYKSLMTRINCDNYGVNEISPNAVYSHLYACYVEFIRSIRIDEDDIVHYRLFGQKRKIPYKVVYAMYTDALKLSVPS